MNRLGLEEVCKGDKKHLHSFTILTFAQDRLLPQVQKTELQTRRQNGKRSRKNKIVTKCSNPFLKYKPFWIKAKAALYLPGQSWSQIYQMLQDMLQS